MDKKARRETVKYIKDSANCAQALDKDVSKHHRNCDDEDILKEDCLDEDLFSHLYDDS